MGVETGTMVGLGLKATHSLSLPITLMGQKADQPSNNNRFALSALV
jgi:hypothetical protein